MDFILNFTQNISNLCKYRRKKMKIISIIKWSVVIRLILGCIKSSLNYCTPPKLHKQIVDSYNDTSLYLSVWFISELMQEPFDEPLFFDNHQTQPNFRQYFIIWLCSLFVPSHNRTLVMKIEVVLFTFWSWIMINFRQFIVLHICSLFSFVDLLPRTNLLINAIKWTYLISY